MKTLMINLLALVIITAAILCSIPFAVADGVSYLAEGVRSLFRKVTAYALKFVLAAAGLTGSLTVMAADTGIGDGVGFLSMLYESWGELSIYVQVIGVLWLLVPVFSFIVSITDTPVDDNVWGKYIYPVIEKLAIVTFKAKQSPGDGLTIKPFGK
tara:strand:+ start:16835 stop:17299 length:465 start_codon:yes stop_codon:yes gene_type:complete